MFKSMLERTHVWPGERVRQRRLEARWQEGTSGGTQRALAYCPSTSEELGISNSFLGHDSSGTPSSFPSLSGLLEASPPHLRVCGFCRQLWSPSCPSHVPLTLCFHLGGPWPSESQFCQFSMAAWVSSAGCILCSELGLQNPSLPWGPSSICFLGQEWVTDQAWKLPCGEGWYQSSTTFQSRTFCLQHESNSWAELHSSSSQGLSQRADGSLWC